MGRRHAALAFMPGKFVFPGGRADPGDGAMVAASELSHDDTQKLLTGMGTRATQRRARALGLCAIRETFEETGLRISRQPSEMPCISDRKLPSHKSMSSDGIILPDNKDWCAFLEHGALPALGDLRYFARAVTPPGHVRRFDTRFFIAFRDSLPGLEDMELIPSGELEDLGWVDMNEVDKLDVARITQTILKEAQMLLSETPLNLPAMLPVAQYSKRYGRFVREVI